MSHGSQEAILGTDPISMILQTISHKSRILTTKQKHWELDLLYGNVKKCKE